LIQAVVLTSFARNTKKVSKLSLSRAYEASRINYLQHELIAPQTAQHVIQDREQYIRLYIRRRRLTSGAFFVAYRKVVSKKIIARVFSIVAGITVAIAIIMLGAPSSWATECDLSAEKINAAEKVPVSEVVDGDTVRLKDGQLVRFIGINTPEIDHKFGHSDPFAEIARSHLRRIIAKHDGQVILIKDKELRDRYRRQLAHIFEPTGENIQAELLANGLGAWIVVPPNTAYMDCYQSKEKIARSKSKGVWSEQFKAPIDTKTLTEKQRGFQWIRGKVSRLGKGKKYWWLNFEDSGAISKMHRKHSKVTLRIHKNDLHYFKEHTLNGLINKVITVRGWLSKYKEQLVMSLRHPASLEVSSRY
jgi:micrococcal nuclease